MGWIGNAPSQGLFNGGQIVDGTVDTVDLKDSAVTAAKLSSTAIKDKLATDQFLAVPRGTTAQRPVSPEIGYTRYNTDLSALENYTADGWIKVSIAIPTLSSVSGTIYSGLTSTITLTGTLFGASPGVVRFSSGATVKDVAVTPSSSTSLSVAVPSEIYNLSANSAISIKYTNGDGGVSGTVDKISVGIPTGGTITTNGGYRYHTFNSSDNLTIPANFSASAQYLIVGGGGGAGGCGAPNSATGGGGAGGYISNTLSLSQSTLSVVIGAGGAGGAAGDQMGQNTIWALKGSNTTAFSNSAIGGGASPNSNAIYNGSERNGGSGSGGTGNPNSGLGFPGTGTSGQGNSGGNSSYGQNGPYYGGGGGGGASANGSNANLYGETGGNGGAGSQWLNGSYYAGGGGGGTYNSTTFTSGGTGGGGNGAGNGSTNGYHGSSNTGGGGGGVGGRNGGGSALAGGNGGSGIVIIRYPLPT